VAAGAFVACGCDADGVRTRTITCSAALSALVFAACGGGAATGTAGPVTTTATTAAATPVKLHKVGEFDQPLYLTAPRTDKQRVFVVQQGGVIKVVRAGSVLSQPFLDISNRVENSGEQGLLGMAFAPDYEKSGLFYVYFTLKDGRQALEEYKRVSADRASAGSARRVFTHDDPESNHNGGHLAFGPDNLLYIGTGDGGGGGDPHGSRGNGQNLNSPLGKILRIDPRASGGRPYTVPANNPFRGRSRVPEIYSYGLRNPWRFSFDRSTGALTIADVGQSEYEEINYASRGKARGANFGWRVYEGNSRFAPGSAPGAVKPKLALSHSSGYCSITGGYVVRDRGLGSLYGSYLFGDFCKPGIRAVKLSSRGAGAVRLLGAGRSLSSISSFGEDASGRVYVMSLDGPVYRLTR